MDVNMVADALDHDSAIARANIPTVPTATQRGMQSDRNLETIRVILA